MISTLPLSLFIGYKKRKTLKIKLRFFRAVVPPSVCREAHVECISGGATIPAEMCADVHALARGVLPKHAPRAPRGRHAASQNMVLSRQVRAVERTLRASQRALQYPASCALCVRIGARPRMPLYAMRRLLCGYYSTCRAACNWRAVARVAACLCVPLGAISVGATVPAEYAPAVCVGCSPLLATASPHAPAMPGDGKSPPTQNSFYKKSGERGLQ